MLLELPVVDLIFVIIAFGKSQNFTTAGSLSTAKASFHRRDLFNDVPMLILGICQTIEEIDDVPFL